MLENQLGKQVESQLDCHRITGPCWKASRGLDKQGEKSCSRGTSPASPVVGGHVQSTCGRRLPGEAGNMVEGVGGGCCEDDLSLSCW